MFYRLRLLLEGALAYNKTMADKYFADQFDNEEVLFVFRKHPVVMRKGLIFGMLALLLGTIPSIFNGSYTYYFVGLACGAVVGAFIFLPWWVNWFFSVFIVTDQRLIQITQRGLFNRSVVDMGLNQIQMVNYEVSGLQETMLGFGTIMMQTFVGDLVIHEIHHPAHIQKKLLEILRDHGPAPGAGNSPYNADKEVVQTQEEDVEEE